MCPPANATHVMHVVNRIGLFRRRKSWPRSHYAECYRMAETTAA